MDDKRKGDEVDVVAEAAKLPLTDRIVHRNWKVREDAYRSLAEKFDTAEENAKIYTDLFSYIGKIVRDANAPAQLVGFEAVIKYADAAPPQLVRRAASDAVKGIVEKGLAGRPANKQKAIDTFLMFVAADAGDLAIDVFITVAFKHRTPKVIVAALEAVALAIDTYGAAAAPAKPVVPKVGPLLGHAQEPVRNAAKALVILLQRWIGNNVKPVLKDAKEVIIKELEAAFEKNAKLGRPRPKKRTRAMEKRVRQRGGGEVVDEDDGFGEGPADDEEEDIVEEINLIERLAKVKIEIDDTTTTDWYKAVDCKKWSARKNAIDAAINIIGDTRLIPVSHQDVFSRMRKIIAKDANVNVVASAARLIAAMAGGLKKNFPPGMAKALMVDLFGRLKEKNKVVTEPVATCLDELHLRKCVRFFECLEEISTAAAQKAPKGRAEIFKWLSRCIMNGTAGIELKGAPLKCFGTLFRKATDDSTPEVRDAALCGLAALQKLIGEKNVAPYVEKLDKKRKDKVASIFAKLPEPAKVVPAQTAKAGPARNTRAQTAKRSSGASAARNSLSGVATPTSAKPSAKKVVKKKKKKKEKKAPVPMGSDDEGETSISAEDSLAKAAERFEGFEPGNLSVKSFKARGAAVGFVTAGLAEKETLTDEEIAIVLGILSTPPGLADSNFMASKPKLELFGMVAKKCTGPIPRKTLKPLLSTSMEKLGDIKSAKMVAEILMSFVEATSPRYFLEILAECAKETKNSRALIGMLKMATSVVEDFGIPPVPEKPIVEIASPNLTNGATAAKNGAIALACKSASRAGTDKFRALLEAQGCESDGLEAFDAEMTKYGRAPDPPTRKKRFETPVAAPESEESEEESEEDEVAESAPPSQDYALEESKPPEEPEVEEVVPEAPPVAPPAAKRPSARPKLGAPRRALKRPEPPVEEAPVQEETSVPPPPPPPTERISIASEFAAGARIFLELKNSNWKKRQDALTSIQGILDAANNHIKPNVGNEIIPALRTRLNDSNRNLAAMAFDVTDQFMRAMGPGGAVHMKNLAPGILGQGMADIKKTVREAAMRCLDTSFELYGMSQLLPYCPLPLASLNAAVRKGFLEWLIPRVQGGVGEFNAAEEDLACLVDPCLNCLRDKTAEVRHLAEMCLECVVKSVGIAVVDNRVASLSKAARLQLEPTMDKFRETQPEAAGAEASHIPKPSSVSTPRGGRERPRSVAVPRTPLHRRNAAGGGGEDDATPGQGIRRQRPASARVGPVVPPQMAGVGSEDVGEAPMLKANDGRPARAQRFLDKRMQFAEELSATDPESSVPPLIGEDIEDIARDLKDCCFPRLFAKLTAPANRFRMHVDAIEMVSLELEDNPDVVSSVSDVLLRWAAFRIDDMKTPPTVLVKLAGFVSHMCEVLMSSGVKLGEYEASSIIPPIVEKVGSNRESVRIAMSSALLSVSDIVEDEILLVLHTSCFRKPMTVRSYTEVSKEICRLIAKRCSSGAGIPKGILQVIGRIAGGKDDGAGRAAAACLERAHEFFGDDLWSFVGELSNAEAALLDDRLTSVINGMRQGLTTPSAPEMEGSGGNKEQGHSGVEAFFPGQAGNALPNDIRNEDFRLSVAPAPPSSVLASISDSLNSSTPMKTRDEMGVDNLPSTPSLPDRQAAVEPKADSGEQRGLEILNRLHSPDRDVQLSGLATIIEDFKGEASLLRLAVGAKILVRLVRCFGDTLERLEGGVPLEDDAAVLKSFLKGVIRFAREPDVLKRMDQSSVEYLLSDALNAMIPQKVEGVDDWDQVRRGVNLMIVKVLESCDQNLLFTAMINLLLANIRTMQRDTTDKMPALAKSSICIKSIAKVAKRGFQECRINALLRDIHVFLKANPVRREGESSAEDQTFAMRLLKTVVNAVIDEIGAKILQKLDLIAQPEKSQLVQYVQMSLKDQSRASDDSPVGVQAGAGGGGGNGHSKDGGSGPGGSASGSPSGIGKSVGGDRGNLPIIGGDAAVLKGEKRSSVDSAGGGSGAGGDAGVGVGVGTGAGAVGINVGVAKRGSVAVESGGGGEVGGGGSGHSAGQVYLKRLHEIQLQYGLQSRAVADSGTVEKENGSSSSSRQPSGEEAKGKAYSLRERMARIRELQSGSGAKE